MQESPHQSALFTTMKFSNWNQHQDAKAHKEQIFYVSLWKFYARSATVYISAHRDVFFPFLAWKLNTNEYVYDCFW